MAVSMPMMLVMSDGYLRSVDDIALSELSIRLREDVTEKELLALKVLYLCVCLGIYMSIVGVSVMKSVR